MARMHALTPPKGGRTDDREGRFDYQAWMRQIRVDQARRAIRLAAIRAQYEATCRQVDKIGAVVPGRPDAIAPAPDAGAARRIRNEGLVRTGRKGAFDRVAWENALHAQQVRNRNRVRAVLLQHAEIMRHIARIEKGGDPDCMAA